MLHFLIRRLRFSMRIYNDSDLEMAMKIDAVKTRERQENGDLSEAAHVDEEYECLLKNKDQGITFEEYCCRRGIRL